MWLTIPCPLLADEDVCGQPLTITVAPELRATRDDPGSGAYLDDVQGPCSHARLWQTGDLDEDDVDALFETCTTEIAAAEAEAYETAMEARLEAWRERDL